MARIRRSQCPGSRTGRRLVICRDPLLAEERARKREDLLQATERALEKIKQAAERERKPLRGKTEIALRVGKTIGKYKVGKHFKLTITPRSFRYERREERIAEEAALDGIYIVRTSVPADVLTSAETVACYKRLSTVGRAFHCMKTVDLKVRPIFHHVADRVRAHVFICMLASYVDWHMREMLRPILFEDEDKEGVESARDTVVLAARRSARAEAKAAKKGMADEFPVHSFQTLLSDLATLTKNHVRTKTVDTPGFVQYARPTRLQDRAFNPLGVSPDRL